MMGCWVCFGLMPCEAAAAEGAWHPCQESLRAAHGCGDPLWGCLSPGALPFHPQHGCTSSLLLDPLGVLPGLLTHRVLLDLLWDAAKTVQGCLQKVPAEFGGGIRMYRNDPTRTWTTGSHMCKQTKFYCFSKRDGFKSFIFLPVG